MDSEGNNMISASIKDGHIHSLIAENEPIILVNYLGMFNALVKDHTSEPNLVCVALRIEAYDIKGCYSPNIGNKVIELYKSITSENEKRDDRHHDGKIVLTLDCSESIMGYLNAQLTTEDDPRPIHFIRYWSHLARCNARNKLPDQYD